MRQLTTSDGWVLPARSGAGVLARMACLAATTLVHAQAPDTVDFNRDIRPILSNACFRCHGTDVKANKAGVRLDRAELATAPVKHKNGTVRVPIVPGRPGDSEVWRRITTTDKAEAMPPSDALHQITARDRQMIRRWIEQGANYAPHWAYILPKKSVPPAIRTAAARNPVDNFILAALEERHIAPAPEADRRTLLRRVSLDLTGLPPTPAEVAAFVADPAPGAYERAVDRLLASPHYGERMAVPWLDLVRFADTVGFHGDQRQNVFPYRDYVIDAFNRNKPFDQFTREQLAGDLLPDATVVQRVATGFNRLSMMSREGGAQPKEYLAKYAADRVRTVSTAWLGSTVGCAECHDHKYDPFATRDFYSLSAYFADVKQWGVYSDYKSSPSADLEGFNNDYPFPPEIEAENPYLVRQLGELRKRYAIHLATTARALLADPDGAAAVATWTATVRAHPAVNTGGWAVVAPEKTVTADGVTSVALPDGSVRFETVIGSAPLVKEGAGEADIPKTKDSGQPVHLLTLRPPPGPLAAVLVTVLPDEKHGGRVGRDGRDYFEIKVAFEIQRTGQEKPEKLDVVAAFPDSATETYENGYRLASVARSWRTSRELGRQKQAAVFLPRHPVTLHPDDRLVATFTPKDAGKTGPGHLGRVRLAVSPFGLRPSAADLDRDLRAALDSAAPTAEQTERLAAEYVKSTGTPAEALAEAQRLLIAIAECHDGHAWSLVTESVPPLMTRVLPRGNWQDESGEIVAPAPPGFLIPRGQSAGTTRLDLANWITSRDNPLTSRVFVNRLWRQFFGTGLSAVVDDLGLQGEYPSHPELLDWLAAEFMDRGWDVKAMVRLIVTSATYRQSARFRPELQETDPQNRLLARQNARQLEAEFVRDNALAAAGLLNPEVGGPSAAPYQPEGYYAQLNFPLRDYQADTGPRQYRRGLYMHWQRTFLHPMLANFDASSREECTAARNVSNTPQQALTLLNDPTFVEAARTLAARVLTEAPSGDFAARLTAAFERVLARPPAARETEALGKLYHDQLAVYRAAPDDARRLAGVGLAPAPPAVDPVELAAWTAVTRVLVNLNEAIVRY